MQPGEYKISRDWAKAHLKDHLEQSAAVKKATLKNCADDILAGAELIADCLGLGGKLLICGNGGSAADSQHLAAEFVSCLTQKYLRKALPAMALTTDSSVMTAFSNDFGFQGVFARQVEAMGEKGDVLIGISTSGGSGNVVEAMRQAGEQGMKTISLTGRGGPMAEMADVAIKVPCDFVLHIQESHIAVEHLLCALSERMLFGPDRVRP